MRQAGADWLGPPRLQSVLEALGWPDSGCLFPLHSARRALLRARLALSHLLDPTPRQPERWETLVAEYLSLAKKAIARLSAPSAGEVGWRLPRILTHEAFYSCSSKSLIDPPA